jgi:hypothetical protein
MFHPSLYNNTIIQYNSLYPHECVTGPPFIHHIHSSFIFHDSWFMVYKAVRDKKVGKMKPAVVAKLSLQIVIYFDLTRQGISSSEVSLLLLCWW